MRQSRTQSWARRTAYQWIEANCACRSGTGVAFGWDGGRDAGRVCDSSDQSYSLTRQSFIIAGIGWRNRIVGVGSVVWRVEEAKMGSCVASDDVSGIPQRIQNGDRQGLLAI